MVIFRPSVHLSGVVCRGLPVSIIRVWAEELKKERQLTTRVRPSPPYTADYVGCLWKYYWLYFDFKLFTKPKKVLNICIFFSSLEFDFFPAVYVGYGQVSMLYIHHRRRFWINSLFNELKKKLIWQLNFEFSLWEGGMLEVIKMCDANLKKKTEL